LLLIEIENINALGVCLFVREIVVSQVLAFYGWTQFGFNWRF